ncbi:hypothetical protein KY316_01110, partial [Candidatus Woesearchaeota archaeon]|nr:hypothetical protein [Candidatus Woesearchaeota archaeon]
MLVQGMEWFIASGGAAGQQVPHFILHLIPREEGDGLENFNLKEGAVSDEQVKEFMPKIKDRLLVALGKKKPEKLTKEKLFEIIEKSPKLKETMVEKPEEFKKMVEATPQLKQMFADFNIDEIIAELKAGKKEGEEEKKEDKGNGKADLDKITDVLNKDGM